MSEMTEAFRAHHRELLDKFTKEVNALEEQLPEASPQALLAFLKDELLPHAVGEERYLYPVVDSLIKAHGSATRTMSIDHEGIQDYIAQIEDTVHHLPAAKQADEHEVLEKRLRRLTVQLDAVLRLHLLKEEQDYLPLVERYLPIAEQQSVLDAMHGGGRDNLPEAQILDVSKIAPPRRHPMIFQTFAALKPGCSFTLVNDHDPKPLYYQFKAELEGQFTWEYLERGPTSWRVRIGKTENVA
jgi:uncharacterized protein (DUF2249 family)/hemerythrin-like domain-containing protein